MTNASGDKPLSSLHIGMVCEHKDSEAKNVEGGTEYVCEREIVYARCVCVCVCVAGEGGGILCLHAPL